MLGDLLLLVLKAGSLPTIPSGSQSLNVTFVFTWPIFLVAPGLDVWPQPQEWQVFLLLLLAGANLSVRNHQNVSGSPGGPDQHPLHGMAWRQT